MNKQEEPKNKFHSKKDRAYTTTSTTTATTLPAHSNTNTTTQKKRYKCIVCAPLSMLCLHPTPEQCVGVHNYRTIRQSLKYTQPCGGSLHQPPLRESSQQLLLISFWLSAPQAYPSDNGLNGWQSAELGNGHGYAYSIHLSSSPSIVPTMGVQCWQLAQL